MKKWISFILVLATLVLCLVGCGDKEPEDRHFKDPSEQETVTKNDTDESTAETAGNPDKELPRLPINIG